MLPIILVHGICGIARLRLAGKEVRYFGGLQRALEARGHAVLSPQTPPLGSVASRAESLRRQIEVFLEPLPARKRRFILIAHSMGGLDSRYLISRLGMANQVEALLTVATPHHGTHQADLWVHSPAMRSLPLLEAMGLDTSGLRDLTTDACRNFNRQMPDARGVKYFSISTACPMHCVPTFLAPAYWLLRHKQGENDTMVPVSSAQWGDHLGTWPVHHLHAIGKRFPIDMMLNPVRDIVPHYLAALDEMGRRGTAGIRE